MVRDAKRDPSLPQGATVHRVDLIHRDAQVDRFYEPVTERGRGLTFD